MCTGRVLLCWSFQVSHSSLRSHVACHCVISDHYICNIESSISRRVSIKESPSPIDDRRKTLITTDSLVEWVLDLRVFLDWLLWNQWHHRHQQQQQLMTAADAPRMKTCCSLPTDWRVAIKLKRLLLATLALLHCYCCTLAPPTVNRLYHATYPRMFCYWYNHRHQFVIVT